jgi:hypothetical protein
MEANKDDNDDEADIAEPSDTKQVGGFENAGDKIELEGGAERFSNLFEGIEDSSSEDDLAGPDDDEVVGKVVL